MPRPATDLLSVSHADAPDEPIPRSRRCQQGGSTAPPPPKKRAFFQPRTSSSVITSRRVVTRPKVYSISFVYAGVDERLCAAQGRRPEAFLHPPRQSLSNTSRTIARTRSLCSRLPYCVRVRSQFRGRTTSLTLKPTVCATENGQMTTDKLNYNVRGGRHFRHARKSTVRRRCRWPT